jgi:predicted nucleic acid-binding protein
LPKRDQLSAIGPLPDQQQLAALDELLIASTAAANGLPLYTRNPSDFDALKRILKVISI